MNVEEGQKQPGYQRPVTDGSDKVNSIGTCSICGYHGPGPKHDCKPAGDLTVDEARQYHRDRCRENLGTLPGFVGQLIHWSEEHIKKLEEENKLFRKGGGPVFPLSEDGPGLMTQKEYADALAGRLETARTLLRSLFDIIESVRRKNPGAIGYAGADELAAEEFLKVPTGPDAFEVSGDVE